MTQTSLFLVVLAALLLATSTGFSGGRNGGYHHTEGTSIDGITGTGIEADTMVAIGITAQATTDTAAGTDIMLEDITRGGWS